MTATPAQAAAAVAVLRTAINTTPYGGWVSDDELQPWGQPIADAVVAAGTPPAKKEAPHE